MIRLEYTRLTAYKVKIDLIFSTIKIINAMSSTINIRNVEDAFERYKMPLLEVKAKNKGQFNQTVIDNVPKVAKSLHVDPECLMRWFGWSLKTQSQFKENNLIMLKGSFSYEQILAQLRKFINQYVLCHKCTYPELNYIAKKKLIGTKCRACGHNQKENLKTDRVWKLIHRIIEGQVEKRSTNPADKFKSVKSNDQILFDFPEMDE